MSDPLINILQQEADLTVGVNEPYVGYLRGDSVDKHSLSDGHNYALIELRNDLIETPDGQDAWAERLAPMIAQALLKAESGNAPYHHRTQPQNHRRNARPVPSNF